MQQLQRRAAVRANDPAVSRDLQRAIGNVHADNLLEVRLLQQSAQQFALAAAEVEQRRAPLLFSAASHRRQSLPLSDTRSGSSSSLVSSASSASSSSRRSRPARARSAVLEVAAGNLFALGCVRQPALAVTQQFLHLVVADPVVLVVVENRDQDVQVAQQSCSGRVAASVTCSRGPHPTRERARRADGAWPDA